MAPKTNFAVENLVPLKGMLEISNPGRLKEVADHWKNVDVELRAAADELKKAVEHATQNWQGAAAQGFATRAGVLHSSLNNTAAHAVQTSSAMNYAGQALEQSKSAMADIDVPSGFESGMKWAGDLGQRSDAQFKADLASGMDRAGAVNKNYDELSATEIAHQRAIVVMEHLGPQYTEAASYLKADPGDYNFPEKPYPPEPVKPPGPIQPPKPPPTIKQPVQPPGTGDGGDKTGQLPGTPKNPPLTPPIGPGLPYTPNNPGLPDNNGILPTTPLLPRPGLNLDSVVPPTTGGLPPGYTPGPGPIGADRPGGGGGQGMPGYTGMPGLGGGGGSRGGAGGGRTGGGGLGGGRTGGGGLGAGKGGSGGLSGGGTGGRGPGGTGTSGGGAHGAGGAAGGAAGARSGAPGMGGMPGAGAAGGAAGGKGSGKPSLVRREGGTVGGAKAGGASGRAFTQGGSGLGQGGAARGGAPGAGGMPGAAGGSGKKKDKGNRPDYLVEDEDTWRSGGKANPPVID